MSDVAFEQARETAAKYIGLNRFRTTGRVRDKLRAAGIETETVERVLAYFQNNGYIDDERAAGHVLARHTGRSMKSKQRLYGLLLAAGVAPETATAVLDRAAADAERAEQLAASLFPHGAEREVIYKRLLSRGFAPNLAATVSRRHASIDDD